MGYLLLRRLMAMHRERRRRQALAHDKSIASLDKRKGSPYQQDDNPRSNKRMRYSGPDLPKDIWQHIHSLMPLRDAARAACVSSAFLDSWRCHPILTFTFHTLDWVEGAKDFIKRIDHIMKKHSGIGVKALTIDFDRLFSVKAFKFLERWLQMAVTPRIQELILVLFSPYSKTDYNFPCSLLSDGSGSSIRHLHLCCCTFRPTAELGCFGSLTRLHLSYVRITGDELGCLLSTSYALEHLELGHCREITYVKIPSKLQQLSYLKVSECRMLQVIENKAPNLCSLHFFGETFQPIQLTFGESSLVKNLYMSCSSVLCHACLELPSIFPNLETLTIGSIRKMINTPMVPSKFLHLKYLSIALLASLISPSYDYFSLVSFLDASPSLETFNLKVVVNHPEDDSIFVNPPLLRQMSGQRHDNLRNVKITGFRSAKSLVELTYYFLENTSIECLTLDTTSIPFRCSTSFTGRCCPMGKGALLEAPKALLAIRTYIEGKIPSTVKLNVVEPCSRCHVVEPLCQVSYIEPLLPAD